MLSKTFRLASLLLTLSLVIATLYAPSYRAAAQEAKTVTYDTPVEGQITDEAFEQLWTLNAPGKDIIRITAERTGGTLAPRVELRDGNGQRIAGADVDYTYATTTVRETTLPSAGMYTVAVGRYNEENGKTSGNYKLTITLLGADEENASMKGQPKPIDYDKAANGELTNARWMEGWTFTAPGKDTVTITAKRLDGTLWPELILQDAAGNAINRASSYRDTASMIDHFTLPGPGPYTVIVKRYGDQNGGTTGTYTVTVSLDGAGEDRPDLLSKPAGAIKYDSTLSGELTSTKWADVYTLDAQSKDHLLLTMTRTDGNLVPEIFLFGANNQELQRARADESFAQAVMDVHLPGPGKYTVRVQRQDGSAAYSSGKYELAITVLGTGEDNPSFKTSAGEAQIGTPTKGTLTNVKWQDSYTVNFESKDPVTITVKRTSGTLIPAIKVLGANQQEVYSMRADDTYAQAVIKDFTIPGPGQYTVIVARIDNANGVTSGGYELSIVQGKAQQ
ncbi:MAG: hypothetical protein IT324_16770 [Anaerolineae bacterium]|nr:hypothetical protein [Anaerolineae bacterium]